MKYPSWAPPLLVARVKQLRESDSSWARIAKLSIDNEDEILDRLLTRPDMKSAWKTISQTPIRDGLPRILATADNSEALWWSGLRPGFEHFGRAPKRTFAENKRALTQLAKMTRNLALAIRKDAVASKKVEFFIQNQVGKDRNDFCIKGLNEPVPWHDLDLPAMAIWGDADHAQDALRRGLMYAMDEDEKSKSLLEKKDETYWRALPAVERFAYWTRELSELNLIRLLRKFAQELESTAILPTAINQPGRQDAGRLPFMVRWMSGYMRARYGKPLDETVAIIVSVALDLPEILTRESVRAYVKSTPEKKMARKPTKTPRLKKE